MYSRKVDCEIFYDRRASVGSEKSSSMGSDFDGSRDSSSSSDHYNPTLRLLQIPRSSNGSMGFHLTRSKWDPYPWISAVDSNTPAKFLGLKAGECVLEVNGEDVLGLRLSEIARLVNSNTRSIDNAALLLWSPGSDNKCNPRNLCCGPMPLNLERLTACTQTILAIIECPVCLETIAPPVLQCQNGHILCVKCRILSHTCPVCRQHFYPGRSLVAEQIYNSIMDTFNLRSPDKLQGTDAQQLFGAKYKRFSSTSMSSSSLPMDERRLRREKQQHRGICLEPSSLEVNKFGSQSVSKNKFIIKLLGRASSMDNLTSPCCRQRRHRQSGSPLSVRGTAIERVADDDVGGNIGKVGRANCNTDDSNVQLDFEKLFTLTHEPQLAKLSKQSSLSARDLSKNDNDRTKAIQEECLSKNRIQYLWIERNSIQLARLQLPLPAPLPTSSELGRQRRRKITPGCEKLLKDERTSEPIIQTYCFTQEADAPTYFCPLNCGKQLAGPTLQQHIKVDHCAPILCYNSSSAELALPLRAPLDKAAAVLLVYDGKDFWIKLRAHGKGSITVLALFQGPEDESSDFMMETRLRNRIDKNQDDDDEEEDDDDDVAKKDDYVKTVVVVNNDDRILEGELITRSIVHSMIVETWEDTCSYVAAVDSSSGGDGDGDGDGKSKGFLFNQQNFRLTFGEAIDCQNLVLKIIIKRR